MNALLCLAILVPSAGVELIEAGANSVLVLDFTAATDEATGRATLVRDQVAAELSQRPKWSVLTSADVERIAGVQADRQVAGCDEDTSCLVELAGAIGADLLIYGSVGQIGRVQSVTISVLNARTGVAVARENIRTTEVSALPELIAEKMTAVFGPIEVEAAPPGEAAPMGAFGVAGWAAVGVGALAALVGGAVAAASELTLADGAASGATKAAASDLGRPMGGVALAGVAVAAVGGGLLLFEAGR